MGEMENPLKRTLLLLGILCLPALALAQTPVPSPTPPTTKLVWDHDGINVDQWKLTVDGVEQVITPTKEAPPAWNIPFPALTPGNHILAVGACNIAGCAFSDPFAVNVVVVPARPSSVRIEVR